MIQGPKWDDNQKQGVTDNDPLKINCVFVCISG